MRHFIVLISISSSSIELRKSVLSSHKGRQTCGAQTNIHIHTYGNWWICRLRFICDNHLLSHCVCSIARPRNHSSCTNCGKALHAYIHTVSLHSRHAFIFNNNHHNFFHYHFVSFISDLYVYVFVWMYVFRYI